jgi:hypothetical protein
MVVGDVINAINAAGYSSFQCAAGVEVMITYTVHGTDGYTGLNNGTTTILNHNYKNATSQESIVTCKLGITNTTYLYIYGVANSGYSGIQIK